MQLSNDRLSSTSPCAASRTKIPMPFPVARVVAHDCIGILRVADVQAGLPAALDHVVPVAAARGLEGRDPVFAVVLGEDVVHALVLGGEEEHAGGLEAADRQVLDSHAHDLVIDHRRQVWIVTTAAEMQMPLPAHRDGSEGAPGSITVSSAPAPFSVIRSVWI